MTGFKESTETWAKVWLDAQKQYLDAWMQMSQQGKKAWAGTQNPFALGGGPGAWADPMQQWTRLMTQALPQGSQETSTRLFDLGKSYLSMGETFWHLMQQGKEFTGQDTDWLAAMKNAFATCVLPGVAGQETDPWSGFATFWGLPLNTWQRFACSFSPFPGELEKALRPEDGATPSDMTKAVRQILSMPPVGYTREWQEQAQEWAQLYLEYVKAMQEFAQLLGKVSQRAAELFSQKLTGLFKEGKTLETLRAAYNLWIDCGEEAYSEVLATPDFPHLQAQMVNALMRLKRHEQTMMDEVMTALNMPTRRELDTTHKRVHGMQQQLGALQEALENITPAEQPADEQRATARAPAAEKPEPPARKKAAVKPARSQAKRRVQLKK